MMRTFALCTAAAWLLVSATQARAADTLAAVFADDAARADWGVGDCGPGELDCRRSYLFPENDYGINFHGWINAGIVGNTDSPNSKFNGPYTGIPFVRQRADLAAGRTFLFDSAVRMPWRATP